MTLGGGGSPLTSELSSSPTKVVTILNPPTHPSPSPPT